VVLLISGYAFSQPSNEAPSIQAKVTLGFDPARVIRRLDSWSSLNVLLENPREPFQGQIVARIYYGTVPTDTYYACPVDLPTGSRKMYRLPMYLWGDAAEVEVNLVQGRKEQNLARPAAPSLSDDLEAVALLARERDAFNFLGALSEDDVIKEDEEQETRQVLYTDTQYLPAHWIAYQSIDALAWCGGANEPPLQPEQVAAFRTWLRMGGRLVLFAGSHHQELAETPWSQFLPLKIAETQTLPEGTQVEGSCLGVPQALAHPEVVTVGTIHESLQPRVLMRAGEIPLVVEVDWAAGSVVYCAFDLRRDLFDSKEAMHQLWTVVFSNENALPNSPVSLMDSPASMMLRSALQVKLPSAGFIAGFLGLYIILVVPVNWLLFRKYKRMEFAWATVPVWAVMFAVAAYYIGAIYQRGTAAFSSLSFVEALPGSAEGRVTSYLSIYSPVRYWYDVTFPGQEIYPQVLRGDDSAMRMRSGMGGEMLFARYDPEGTVISDLLIHHWSQRTVKATHRMDLQEGIAVDAALRPGENLQGSITNRTNYTILNPTIYTAQSQYSLRRYKIGERLKPGEQYSIPEDFEELARPNRNMGQMFPSQPNANFSDPAISLSLMDQYWSFLNADPIGTGYAVLTGRIEEFPLRPSLGRNIEPGANHTLLALLFNPHRHASGIYTIPTDSWHTGNPFAMMGMYGYGGYGGTPPRARRLPQGGMGMPFPGQSQVEPGKAFDFDLVTDYNLRRIRLRRLTVGFDRNLYSQFGIQKVREIAQNPSFLSIRDRRTGEWHPIPFQLNDRGALEPAEVRSMDRMDIQNYVNRRTGTISFRVKHIFSDKQPIQLDAALLRVNLEVDNPANPVAVETSPSENKEVEHDSN